MMNLLDLTLILGLLALGAALMRLEDLRIERLMDAQRKETERWRRAYETLRYDTKPAEAYADAPLPLQLTRDDAQALRREGAVIKTRMGSRHERRAQHMPPLRGGPGPRGQLRLRRGPLGRALPKGPDTRPGSPAEGRGRRLEQVERRERMYVNDNYRSREEDIMRLYLEGLEPGDISGRTGVPAFRIRREIDYRTRKHPELLSQHLRAQHRHRKGAGEDTAQAPCKVPRILHASQAEGAPRWPMARLVAED